MYAHLLPYPRSMFLRDGAKTASVQRDGQTVWEGATGSEALVQL